MPCHKCRPIWPSGGKNSCAAETFLFPLPLTRRNQFSSDHKNLKGRGTTMKRFSLRLMMYSALACLLLSLTALAQDFQHSYSLGSGGSINIRNISGNVQVTGYDGQAVVVTGIKEGRNSD